MESLAPCQRLSPSLLFNASLGPTVSRSLSVLIKCVVVIWITEQFNLNKEGFAARLISVKAFFIRKKRCNNMNGFHGPDVGGLTCVRVLDSIV